MTKCCDHTYQGQCFDARCTCCIQVTKTTIQVGWMTPPHGMQVVENRDDIFIYNHTPRLPCSSNTPPPATPTSEDFISADGPIYYGNQFEQRILNASTGHTFSSGE